TITFIASANRRFTQSDSLRSRQLSQYLSWLDRGVAVRFIDKNVKTQVEPFSLRNGDLALFLPGKCISAERVGHKQTVVSHVKPARAKVSRIGNDQDAHIPVPGSASVLAPLSGFTPDLLFVDPPLAI